MHDVSQWIGEGGALAVLIVVMVGAWRACASVGRQLFDNDHGLVTQWLKDQRDFTNGVKQQNERSVQAQEQTAAAIAELAQRIGEVATGVLQLCTLTQRICDRLDVEVHDEIHAIRSQLEKSQRPATGDEVPAGRQRA